MPPLLDAVHDRAPLTIANVAREIGDGFAYVWRTPVLRALIVVMSLANLGGVGLRTLVLYVLREEQHLDEITLGVALSLSGLALVAGSVLAPGVLRGRPTVLSLGRASLR